MFAVAAQVLQGGAHLLQVMPEVKKPSPHESQLLLSEERKRLLGQAVHSLDRVAHLLQIALHDTQMPWTSSWPALVRHGASHLRSTSVGWMGVSTPSIDCEAQVRQLPVSGEQVEQFESQGKQKPAVMLRTCELLAQPTSAQSAADPLSVYLFAAQAVQFVAFASHVKQELWQAMQTAPLKKKPSGQPSTQVELPYISSWPGGQEVQLVLLPEQVKQLGSHMIQ